MILLPPGTEGAVLDLGDRLVVAPGFGRVELRHPWTVTSEGELVRTGEVLAEVDHGSGRLSVRSPVDGWVLDVLVRHGERVRPGHALFHLREL